MARGCLGDEEIDDDLALWRQQCGEAAETRRDRPDIGRDQAAEEIARIFAADLDHAAVGEETLLS